MMTKYYYIVYFPDGETFNSKEEGTGCYGGDGTFDTYEDASYDAGETISNYNAGGEILHLSNPGDYDWDGDLDLRYEIFEFEV